MGQADVKYTLAMIVRDCAEDLDKCLASYAEYPDEIVIVNTALHPNERGYDETNAVAKKYGAKIFDFPWVHDFSKARNFSFSKVSHDLVMWLDSDDKVHNARRLDANIRLAFEKDKVGAIVVEYLYEFDEAGNCTTRLNRERVVDRRSFEWRAPIHECLCATHRIHIATIPSGGGQVVHSQIRGDDESTKPRLDRNLVCFEKNFSDGKCELRMLFYWANTLFGLARWDEALVKYEEYIRRDNNLSQVQVALCSSSEAHRFNKDYEKAIDCATKAIAINPENPSPYLQMAEAYCQRNDTQFMVRYALATLNHAEQLVNEMVVNPKAIQGRPHVIAMRGYAMSGAMDMAYKHAKEAKKFYPGNEDVQNVIDEYHRRRDAKVSVDAFVSLRDSMLNNGSADKVPTLARAVSQTLINEPEVHRVLPKERQEGVPSIAFHCLGGSEIWGPDSIKDGIGGSEEAVINMTRELAKRGWHVEVYCSTPEPTVADGVRWYPLQRWTGERDSLLDVVVYWRSPDPLRHFGVNAKSTYLWAHDVVFQPSTFYGFWEDLDGIFVLSDFHKTYFSFVPGDKLISSRNAMDADLFVPVDDLENNPHRLVYTSCPSRGLLTILRFWDRLRDACPDLEIDIYYGFTRTFENQRLSQLSEGVTYLDDIKREVGTLKDKPGIHWHGMVGQDELAKAYAKAGIWAYPTDFPEISCITAMKAQAHGCWPVYTNDFALKETVTHGDPVPGPMTDSQSQETWFDAMVARLANPPTDDERMAMIRDARGNTWERLAGEWDALFKERLKCPSPKQISWGSLGATPSRS